MQNAKNQKVPKKQYLLNNFCIKMYNCTFIGVSKFSYLSEEISQLNSDGMGLH